MQYDKMKSESYQLLGGINSKVSVYQNGPMEFRDLSNVHFSVPGALTKRPGTSFYIGSTLGAPINGVFEFAKLNGASYLFLGTSGMFYTVTNAYNQVTNVLGFSLSTGLMTAIAFVDRLFFADGKNFLKFDGTNIATYNLPVPGGYSAFPYVGGSLTAGVTGVFVVAVGGVNDRGYYGPVGPGITLVLNGITFNSILYANMQNSTPSTNYGASGMALYRTSAGGKDLTYTFTVAKALADVGGSTFLDVGTTFTTRLQPNSVFMSGSMIPKYLEIYNNQLFMAGFSNFLSSVYWSEIGEPEGVDANFNAQFRTNDGDRITGVRSYLGSLIVSKERSFHRITGSDPNDFLLVELSDQYGCLSHRAMVVWETNLWFLDTKGIAQYDGAQVKIISNKVQPIFDSMNIPAARENACAIHNRKDNEVWFAIPVNGSTVNNMIVVYDYLADAWTHYDGLNVAQLFMAQAGTDIKRPFYAGYSGEIAYFGASIMNDNGSAITCLIDAPYLTAWDSPLQAPDNHSIERLWRRFYLDVNPILGFTQAITVNFRMNYGTSISLTRTMYQSQYQSRIDFGLAGRAIQTELSHVSASLPFQVNGYTFESRFQRAT